MHLTRFDSPGLAHYSYVLADRNAGVMAVVDPRRDIAAYLEYARRFQLRIAHILETHIHADYCSGAAELAAVAGAPVAVSKYDEGETYAVAFPHCDLSDGDEVTLGSIQIRALHTPGHTPEHLAFLVWDQARSREEPLAMLSGDFLFVGSLGRPDLLGEAQKTRLAQQMFHSVRAKLAGLHDGLEIYPAHGAGSLCGAGMGGRPESTLGFERITNPYLDPGLSEVEFVQRLLEDVPPFPPYYRRMKQINALGPPPLSGRGDLAALSPEAVERIVAAGGVVIDLRDQLAFGGGHIPGAFGIALGNLLPVWAAWVVPYDVRIVLVGDSPNDGAHAATLLARVGLDMVAGVLEGGIKAWRDSGRELSQLPQITAPELARVLVDPARAPMVLDVRTDREWEHGHIEGAVHEFGGTIEDHLGRLPDRDHPVVITCGGGYRSTVVASVLQRRGFVHLFNLTGGMGAWNHAGLPVVAGFCAPQSPVPLRSRSTG